MVDNMAVTGREEIKASPRARSLAAERGIDLASVTATGPNGRVLERDVIAADAVSIPPSEPAPIPACAPEPEPAAIPVFTRESVPEPAPLPEPAPPPEPVSVDSVPEPVPVSASEPVPAPPPQAPSVPENIPAAAPETAPPPQTAQPEAMLASADFAARGTVYYRFDATAILQMLEAFRNADGNPGVHEVTLCDIILFALSRTLALHPEINAYYIPGIGTQAIADIHVALADGGAAPLYLLLRNTNRLTLTDLSAQVRMSAPELRGASFGRGATFTVFDLSAAGAELFVPPYCPPQVAALGIGAPLPQFRVEAGADPAVFPAITLALSFDGRALNTAAAHAFLRTLGGKLAVFSWETLFMDTLEAMRHG